MRKSDTGTEPEEIDEHPQEQESAHKPINHWAELGTRLGVALLVTLLLIFLEVKFENSTTGELVEDTVHAFIHTFAPPANESAHVQVIDISDLPRTTKGSMLKSPTGVLSVTSRDDLKKLIGNITKFKPLAIGVDLDFSSSDPKMPVSVDDEQFFKWAESLPVTVVLGVERSVWSNTQEPFAFQEAPKGGWLGLQNEWPGLVPITYIAPDGTKMDSLSQATKQSSGLSSHEPGVLLRTLQSCSILEDDVIRPIEGGAQVESRPIQFSYLGQYEQRLLTYDPTNPNFSVAQNQIKNHIVLLGDVRDASDWFIAYGRRLVPGVYIHGSAIDTALRGGKFRVSDLGNVVVDVLLAGIGFGIFQYLKRLLHSRNKRLDEKKLTRRLSLMGAVSVLVLAWITNSAGVEWLSFDVVFICAFLHPKLDEMVLNVFKRKRRAQWRKSHARLTDAIVKHMSEEDK